MSLAGSPIAHLPRRRVLLATAGALASAAFVVRADVWLALTVLFAMALVWVALVKGWRGGGDARANAVDAVTLLGAALALPLLLVVVGAASGRLAGIAAPIVEALPDAPWAFVATTALASLALVLALDGARAHRASQARVAVGVAIVAALLVVARAAWIASMASLPTETFWPEGPFLVNALKLDAHATLYGPPGDLDSYMYSPLLELAHHALLAPLGAELSLRANRALVIADEAAAAAIVAWALWPKLRARALGAAWGPLALATIALASFSNMLAATVHPDHALLLAFAVALALLVAERRWRRGAWWAALVLVTPIAACAKLTGAFLGLGLAAAMAIERRWRAVGALAASGVLTLATLPLFGATLGRYTFYVLTMPALQPMEWGRARDVVFGPVGFAALVVAIAFVALRRLGPSRRATRRALVLTLATLAGALPAFLKYAGRENNFAIPILGAAVVVLLRVADARGERRPHPALGFALALLVVVAFAPPEAPIPPSDRALLDDAAARMVAVLRTDDAAGRTTLLPLNAAPWIAAGRRDVPRDRFASAANLFLSGLPEADAFFAHLDDGRWDVIVTPPVSDAAGPSGAFAARFRAAVSKRYAPCAPPSPAVLVFCRTARPTSWPPARGEGDKGD